MSEPGTREVSADEKTDGGPGLTCSAVDTEQCGSSSQSP